MILNSISRVTRVLALACTMWGLSAAPSQAAVLVFDGAAVTGATGVSVGGSLFDVEFVSGTCLAVFPDCSESTVFVFPTAAEAVGASQALFDQVFPLDGAGAYINSPALVDGCGGTSCLWVTPFDVAGVNVVFGRGAFFSLANPASNFVSDTADRNFVSRGWARWSASAPVPEPSSLALLGLGVAGLGWARRRRADGGGNGR